MKKLYPSIICVIIGISLASGFGKVAIAQDDPSSLPAPRPDSETVLSTIIEIEELIKEHLEEIKDIINQKDEMKNAQRALEKMLKNLEDFEKEYTRMAKSIAKEYAGCTTQDEILKAKIASENPPSSRYIKRAREIIDECYSKASDERATLLSHNYLYKLREEARIMREDRLLDEIEFKILDARQNTLSDKVKLLNLQLKQRN